MHIVSLYDNEHFPAGARRTLGIDQYIDEFGLLQRGHTERHELETLLPPDPEQQDFAVEDPDAEDEDAEGKKIDHGGKKKWRRDRRHLELDEMLQFDLGGKTVILGAAEYNAKRNNQIRRELAETHPEYVDLADYPELTDEQLILKEDEYVDESGVVRSGWKRRDRLERHMIGEPLRTTLAKDEYVDLDGGGPGRLRVGRRVKEPKLTEAEYLLASAEEKRADDAKDPNGTPVIPEGAKRTLNDDEYLDEYGVVRRNIDKRRALDAKPKIQLEEGAEFFTAIIAEDVDFYFDRPGGGAHRLGHGDDVEGFVAETYTVVDTYSGGEMRSLRRDRRWLEHYEHVVVDDSLPGGDQRRRVQYDRRTTENKDEPVITKLALHEWVDDANIVHTNWEDRDAWERTHPEGVPSGRPVKFTLKRDEYIDTERRLRVREVGDDPEARLPTLPLGCVCQLAFDEWVDEFGLIRQGRVEREMLEHRWRGTLPEDQEMQVEVFPKSCAMNPIFTHIIRIRVAACLINISCGASLLC